MAPREARQEAANPLVSLINPIRFEGTEGRILRFANLGADRRHETGPVLAENPPVMQILREICIALGLVQPCGGDRSSRKPHHVDRSGLAGSQCLQ